MALIRSTRTPYLSIDPDTRKMFFTGRLAVMAITFSPVLGYKFAGTHYTEEELLIAFFPTIAKAMPPAAVRAQGIALRARLRRK